MPDLRGAWSLRVRVGLRPWHFAPVVLVLALLSCADAPAAGGGAVLERLAFVAESPWPASGHSIVVETLDIDGSDAWEFQAPNMQALPGRDGTTRAMVLVAGRPIGNVRFSRKGRYAPSDFDRIDVVVASFSGVGSLVADLLRDGVVVGSTDVVDLVASDAPQVSSLDVPDGLALQDVPFDEIAVRCFGDGRRLTLAGLRLSSRPELSWLPPPEAPRLVPLGGDLRRAVGLVSGSPLTTEVGVPAGARLVFSYGRPDRLLRRGTSPVLHLAVEAPGVATLERSMEFGPATAARARWHDVSWDLGAFADREARITLRLEDALGDETVSCAVAGARLLVDGPQPPTVLLVTSASHRADHLDFIHRGVDIETPALRALAERGTCFADAFVTTNGSLGSLASLMTGLNPRDTGLLDDAMGLADDAQTLAEAFAAGGFATVASVGDRRLLPATSGMGQGFDRVALSLDVLVRPGADVAATAREWLPELAGQPLFLWVQLADAEWPHEPGDALLARYYDMRDDPRDERLRRLKILAGSLPPRYRDVRDLRWPKALYKGELTAVDTALGRLLEEPRLSAGVVAYTADHGMALGEQGTWFKHLGLNPGVLRVPLLLAGPGVPAGIRSALPVVHTDIGRTLLDLAGLSARPFPGRDLLEQLADERTAPRRFAIEGRGHSASITAGGLHLVLNLQQRRIAHVMGGRQRHETELYDLRTDPKGEVDVLAEHMDEARQLRATLVRWLSERPHEDLARVGAVDPGWAAQLVDLGYFGPQPVLREKLWEPDECELCQPFGSP